MHSGLEDLDKWEGIFQLRKMMEFLTDWKSQGNSDRESRKVREFRTDVIYNFLLIFKLTVYYLLKWVKFSV